MDDADDDDDDANRRWSVVMIDRQLDRRTPHFRFFVDAWPGTVFRQGGEAWVRRVAGEMATPARI